MSDTPRTEHAFNHAATLSTFAHQRRYLMAQMESIERENAKLRAAFRWFRKYPEFVPNMADHGERVNADISAARPLFTD